MSEVKVNKISPRTNCGTVQLGDSGDTITIPAGATITNNGTQTGFGRTGTVNWQTTIKTAGFTASDGEGYFLNTTSGGFTVNLPAGSAGSIVAFKDYANTWNTGNVTVTPNGSDKIGGANANATLNTQTQSVTLIFTDSTRGWLDIHDSTANIEGLNFVAATGGTVLTCGNFKTHVFTGPGTFCVSAGNGPVAVVDYLVVAGGGGTGTTGCQRGGAGAGGFRLANGNSVPSMSPLANPSSLPVSIQAYPITVGAGGAAGGTPTANPGAASTFSTISSAGGGGGYGGSSPSPSGHTGLNGGSGGGGAQTGGTGNTPPVTPPQGNPGGGGIRSGEYGSGGGGGAGAAGTSGTSSAAGPGGAGSYISDAFIGPTAPSYGTPGPVGSTRYFAGGGGGGAETVYGTGGVGGGGDGSSNPGSQAENGATNTGGGAGTGNDSLPAGKTGGSGIVMIRYKFQ